MEWWKWVSLWTEVEEYGVSLWTEVEDMGLVVGRDWWIESCYTCVFGWFFRELEVLMEFCSLSMSS